MKNHEKRFFFSFFFSFFFFFERSSVSFAYRYINITVASDPPSTKASVALPRKGRSVADLEPGRALRLERLREKVRADEVDGCTFHPLVNSRRRPWPQRAAHASKMFATLSFIYVLYTILYTILQNTLSLMFFKNRCKHFGKSKMAFP